jgi:hypothetical protein
MLASDNSNHSGRLVGPDVVPDDCVGCGEVVACQRESVPTRYRGFMQKRRSPGTSPFSQFTSLERLYVFSLPALRALRNVELHGLPFLKTPEPADLDCREMHKNILAALTADEAVAFGVVEPLHCSLFCHIDTRLMDLRWRDSEVLEAGYWLVGRDLLTTDSV